MIGLSMLAVAAAATFAAPLPGAPSTQVAPRAGFWVFDPGSRCYVFAFGDVPVDEVRWAGECVDRVASGQGAALFSSHRRFAEFAFANFVKGAADGPVQIYRPDGSRLEAKATLGNLTGTGVVTFASGTSTQTAEATATPAAGTSGVVHHPDSELVIGMDPVSVDNERSEPAAEAPSAHDTRQVARGGPISVRESVIHLIDGGTSPADDKSISAAQDHIRVPQTRPPSQCLNVAAAEGDIGFRNGCTFPVRFAYCVAHATRQDLSACDTGSEEGEVPALSFAGLFGAFGQTDYDVRWIACNATVAAAVPRLVHSDPPAGQCSPRQLAAKQ